MGYRENLEIYLNLPRKELQGLCKTNNLPANRSKTELAKSLASFFKKKNTFPALSKERHNNPVELSSSKSFVQETQSKETSENNNKGIVGEYAERTNIQDPDSHKVAPYAEEERGACRQHFSSGKQMEISSHVDGQTVKNTYNIVDNALCPTTESPQVFALTTSGAGKRSPLTNGRIHSNCHTDRPNNDLYKSPEVKKCGHKLLNCAAPSSEVHKLVSVQDTQPRAADCCLEGRVLSPKKNVREATPSFQFFVESDEGIDLHVDLNSSPLEWISGLKDGVAETLKAQHHMPRILSNHNVEYIAVNGCLEISEHGNSGIKLQSNGERSSGCTTSTLSSVSEICQSEGCQPDATVVSSESSVLTSGSLPLEISGGLDGTIVVSSSCATPSNVHESTIVNTCPENSSVLPQNLVDVSNCNTLHLDTSAEPICHIGICNTEGTRKPKEVDCATLNNEVDGSNNVEAKILSRPLSSSLEENKLLKLDEIEKHISISDNLKTDTAACQVSEEAGAKEGSTEVQGRHSRSSSACQLSGQLLLDCPEIEAQPDAGSLDQLNHDECILGSSTVNDQAATLSDELVIITPVKEIKNSSDKNSKRSHIPEVNEELQHKRHRPDENKSEMAVNLRSARTSAKETIPEEVLRPRRSTRLLTK